MIKEYFLKTLHHWKILLQDRAYLWSLFFGVFVLGGAILIDQSVSAYHDKFIYTSVGDLILNSLPTYNLGFIFFWGLYVVIVAIVLYCFFVEPEKVPFGLKTFGLLIIVRACFIVLTYLGPPVGFYFTDTDTGANSWLKGMFFTNDLFFSGHTSLPFLAFLLFKKKQWFRWLMLFGSFVMGATVLFMHVHYSIDVFAAFFITYGVYAFSNKLFNQLNERFNTRLELYGWKSLQKRLKDLKENKIFNK